MTWLKNGLITLALLCSTLTSAKTLDSIVAVVNDDVVTALELTERINMIKEQYRANPSVLPNEAILRTQVLDSLILESLQLQLAKKGNLVIPEKQIDGTIGKLASQQNATTSQFLAAVERSGQTVTQFRAQVKKELTLNELQKQIIGRQIFIADTEVERYLKSQSGQSLQDTQYQLSYLRFDADQEAAAEALKQELNAGKSLLSVDNSRDLGMRKLDEVPSLFKTLVPVLKVGEAVYVERDGVIHLAQLADKTQSNTLNIEEYHIRHILITTDALFTPESAQALLADLKQQIDNGADMAELADNYSQDPGSRGRGGDLDWNSLDNYVPEFGQVARSLTIGEVSDVFESPYGFHIMRVEDKRTRDVGLDALKNQIKNQLYQRRFSASLQRWLTELRAESYVEIRQP